MEDAIFKNLKETKAEAAAAEQWPWSDPIEDDFYVSVYLDKYPVSPGHRLYVPKYCTTMILMEAFNEAFRYGRMMVDNGTWDAYNIGMNAGEAAGQTVKWPHVHLIPRWKGDVEDPIGGVRNVIPGKGNYRK